MLYVMQLGTYILPLLVLPYLSRVLSTEKYGLIAFAQFFMYYFMIITDYGFGLTATRKIAILSEDLPAVSKIYSNVMATRMLLMVMGFAVMVGIVFATPKMRPNWQVFLVCYLGVLGNALFPQWLFQGLQKMQHIVFRDLSAKLFSLAAIFLLVHSDRDYLLAAGLQSTGMVLSGLVSLFTIGPVTGVRLVRPTWVEMREELKGSWPVFLSLAANTTYTSTNTFVLGLVSTPVMVAYYSNAFRVIAALRGLVSPLVTAIYPYISRIASGSSRDGVRFLQRYSFILSSPFLLASIALLLGSPLAVKLFFGTKYAYTGVLLQVMSLSPFLQAINVCFTAYFMLAFGYEREWSRLIWKTTILNFVILIPMMYWVEPAMGLAITGVVLDLFVAGYSFLFYRKHSAEVLRAADDASPKAKPVMAP